MARRPGDRSIAGDDSGAEGLRKGDVCGVVCGDVVTATATPAPVDPGGRVGEDQRRRDPQSPWPRGQVTPRLTGRGAEDPESLRRPSGGASAARPRRERVAPRRECPVASTAGIPAGQTRWRRSRGLALLSDDHRSRRLQLHARSTVDSRQHLFACGADGETLEFCQQVVGERLPGVRGPAFERPM